MHAYTYLSLCRKIEAILSITHRGYGLGVIMADANSPTTLPKLDILRERMVIKGKP